MRIKVDLSDQEQRWLEQIAEYRESSADEVIRALIKEGHEQLLMERAFDEYPDGKIASEEIAATDAEANSRDARKAALKKSFINKAQGRVIED